MKRHQILSNHTASTIALLTAILFSCCKDNSTNPGDGLVGHNVTNIQNVPNVLNYTIDASNYTASGTYDLSFSSDTIACYLVVSSYLSGSFTVVVTNSTSSVVYSDTISSDKNIFNNISGKGIPSRCTMASNNFTGKMAFTFAHILPTNASNRLVIQTDSSIYEWIESEGYPIMMILATLTSTSKDTFYARLGNRYMLVDKPQLFVAEASDGYIEKLGPDNTWIVKQRSSLVEGVRAVAIEPSRDYQLQTFLRWQTPETGVFRVRINYYPRMDSVGRAQQYVDYSNVFFIQ